jgi:MerR family transcriptional regulator/heat shock protein HspR
MGGSVQALGFTSPGPGRPLSGPPGRLESQMPALPVEDENQPRVTRGAVATMLEIQQAFLRRLDDFDVVRPSRSSGRQRRYTRNEVAVVQYVVRLADEGMTLPAIRRILELEHRIRELETEGAVLREALREVRQRLGAAGPREAE